MSIRKWKRLVEKILLLSFFGALIFAIPIHYKQSVESPNNIQNFPKQENVEIVDFDAEIQESTAEFSFSEEATSAEAELENLDFDTDINTIEGLRTNQPTEITVYVERYSPFLVTQFKEQYVGSDSPDPTLMEYIARLIETQNRTIEDQNRTIENYESQLTIPLPETGSNPGLSTITKGIDRSNNSSNVPEIFVLPNKYQLFLREYTNLIYVGLTTIVTLCAVLIYYRNFRKFINLSGFINITSAVVGGFASIHLLIGTVPSLVNQLAVFDAMTMALAPIALVWLTIKGLIETVVPQDSVSNT